MSSTTVPPRVCPAGCPTPPVPAGPCRQAAGWEGMPPPPPTGPPTTNCCRRARDRPSTWAAGPGRFVAALAARGIPALGVDISAAAVQMTIQRGGTALHQDLFAPLPGHGRWARVLLADGNIGIGGGPSRRRRRRRPRRATPARRHRGARTLHHPDGTGIDTQLTSPRDLLGRAAAVGAGARVPARSSGRSRECCGTQCCDCT